MGSRQVLDADGTSSMRHMVSQIVGPLKELAKATNSTASVEALAAEIAPKLARIQVSPSVAAQGIRSAAYSCDTMPTLNQLLHITLGERWRESSVSIPRLMIGVGKIYNDTCLAVVYPYVFRGTKEFRRGDLIGFESFPPEAELLENIRRAWSKNTAREKFVRANSGNANPELSDLMCFEKYPEIWDNAWGHLPTLERPNKKCPIISLN